MACRILAGFAHGLFRVQLLAGLQAVLFLQQTSRVRCGARFWGLNGEVGKGHENRRRCRPRRPVARMSLAPRNARQSLRDSACFVQDGVLDEPFLKV
jgi:hypothetical protein